MNDNFDIESHLVKMIGKKLKTENRFGNYKEITAKFNSNGQCGHPIKKGERIGYNKTHGCFCAGCWGVWVAENAEADLMEQNQNW
jgi:hypothetical protein